MGGKDIYKKVNGRVRILWSKNGKITQFIYDFEMFLAVFPALSEYFSSSFTISIKIHIILIIFFLTFISIFFFLFLTIIIMFIFFKPKYLINILK